MSKNISMRKPANQAWPLYKTDDAAWNAFASAAANIPRGFEVPMWIGGQEVKSGDKIKSLDPTNGEVFCLGQKATKEHATMAVEAALGAKEAWAALPLESRLQKFRDLEWILYERRYEFMAVAAKECGYIANEVGVEWAEMIDFIRFNSFWMYELSQTQMGDGPSETNIMNLRPLKGFTSGITPFNFPIAIGYNLPTVMAICGNTVVWKPSSDAPLTSWMLMKAIADAGFPPGVINMITGSGAVVMPQVLNHPELSALNFTGGYDTALDIGSVLYNKELRRPHFPRFVAETGGKDFMYVDKECDVWDVAACIIAGAFGRSGQKCSANSLVLPHRKIWPDLKAALLEQMKSFKVGDVLERSTDMGPVVNESAFNDISGFIERGLKDPKVKTICGGEFSKTKGFWIQPTLFEVDADAHELVNVEIFGPVTTVRVVDDVEHALRIIRSNTYKLTGAVWSSDENFLAKYVPILGEHAGNFYINRKTTGAVVDQQPFGGDGASGTNYKAGGAWYLLQFLSQGSVTRRHARVLRKPGQWGWMG
ncbi:MAG: aldehyde dehydrogenase family protein [Candidatus Eisenbacteria bacterium]|nr:aldehyde dehydrogenase family protein [Candidatus Eisenbacteria bacterium]MCC7143431.1 aldehyde dehydrogenase family protein [Candidatus Eisenbacteria bacterium]